MSGKGAALLTSPMTNSIVDVHSSHKVKDFKSHARKYPIKRNSLKIRKEQQHCT